MAKKQRKQAKREMTNTKKSTQKKNNGKKKAIEISEQEKPRAEAKERAADRCPYCESKDFVKRGVRSNKHQAVQLYVCRNSACGRTFTSRTIKGKQFPWPVVLDAISYHNLGYTFEQTSQILATKRGVAPQPDTIAKWYEEYKPLCRFERLRPYALKILSAWRQRNPDTKFEMVETTTLAHRQLYRFRYHRPKLILMLEEYGNRNFGRLMESVLYVSRLFSIIFIKN